MQIRAWLVELLLPFGCILPLSAQHPEAVVQAHSRPVVFRTVVDLTSTCWFLVPNEVHPAGPGQWLQRPALQCESPRGGTEQRVVSSRVVDDILPRPVIRRGDRLIVEEHSAFADALLEAEALSSAVRGETFKVRLASGNAQVRVVALGPGRATLVPVRGVRP